MSQMLSRRTLAGMQARLVAGIGVALSACVPGTAGTAVPGAETKKPVRLTYVLHNSAKKGVDEKHFPEYKEKNPHVDLDFSLVPAGDLTAKITSLFAAGSGPEIYNDWSGATTAYMDRGWAVEIDYKGIGLGSAQKLTEAYAWPGALDGWKWKGKYYGLPTEISNYCLYINNRMFRKAGLDPQKDYPKDWDDLLAVSQKFTVRDGGQITQRGFELDYTRPHLHWAGHAYQLMGPFVTDDGKVNINNESAARTLQYWADWGQKHQLGSPKLPVPGNTFYEESLAMWASGSWYASGVRMRNEALFNDLTVKPFPRWKDKKYDHGTHVYGYSMMVSSQVPTDVQAEAWRLAWFFSGYPVEHLAAGGLFQPKRDFVESPTFKNFKDVPSMDVFLDDMKKSTYVMKTPAFDAITQVLKDQFLKVWTDGQPAKQVLPDTQRDLERVIREAGTR
jgi:multiple sugar transport system substrate-binding protein